MLNPWKQYTPVVSVAARQRPPGDDHQDDQVTPGPEQSRMTWNPRISVLPLPGERPTNQDLGMQLWTQLRSRFQYAMKTELPHVHHINVTQFLASIPRPYTGHVWRTSYVNNSDENMNTVTIRRSLGHEEMLITWYLWTIWEPTSTSECIALSPVIFPLNRTSFGADTLS